MTNDSFAERVRQLRESWRERRAIKAISRSIEGTLVAKLVSTHDLAHALVALFLGMELMYHLDHDVGLSKRLFGMFGRVSKIASPLLSSPLLKVRN